MSKIKEANLKTVEKWQKEFDAEYDIRTAQLRISFLRKQPPEVFYKKGVLKKLTKFTGKHLLQSLCFNKVAGLACNFIKKEILAQVFFCEFCEISKKTFFTEHLRMAASVSITLNYFLKKTVV